ncbi:hypothetical protein FRC01_001758 [Tulasnella sp. 417]|nr:hypothetical protein FRC01_001758 [Tulasnella sp. 417]
MTDHISNEEQRDQPSPAEATKPQTARISPRKVLESLSTLRIDVTWIKPLETTSWGRGANADVIPAELAPVDASSHLPDAQHVAVKKLRLDNDTDDARVLAQLAHEIHLLNDLSHNNIVKIIGFVEDTKDGIAWMVFAWEKNGNLREFIKSANWEFPERIALIYDVTSGIDYLHNREPPICHGDLKSLNILVNSENRAILTDFGSARALESASGGGQSGASNVERAPPSNNSPPRVEVTASGATMTLTSSKWTLRWAAPELLAGTLPDLASDIWAFGWICWEASKRKRWVMTSNFPFDGENDLSVVLQIVEGKLPSVHGDSRLDQVVALANLMIDCWNLDPDKRPTATSCERGVYWMDRITPRSRNRNKSAEIGSARLLSSLALMHMRHDRTNLAMDLLLRARTIARAVNDGLATAEIAHGLGDVYRLRGEYSRAEESYIASRDAYAQIEDQLGLANAAKALGDIHILRGDYSHAMEDYVSSRDTYTRLGNKNGSANATIGLGDVSRLQGEYSKAEESYSNASSIFAQIGDHLGLANAGKALGDVYGLRGEYSKAEESYTTARDVYTRIGDSLGLANTIQALGNVHRWRGQYSEAEESYVTAREICTRIGDRLGLANAIKALGDVHYSRGRYSKAEESYFRARDICREIGEELGLANAIKALGDVYRLQGKYTEAEKSYVTAHDIYGRIGDRTGSANAIKALGDVYGLRGEYSKAKKTYVTARATYSDIGDQLGLANTVRALGDIYNLRGKFSEAGRYYLDSKTIYLQIGDQVGLAHAITGLGQLSAKRKRYGEAEGFYAEARETYTRIGSKSSLANNLWYTGWLYRSQKRYEEAQNIVSKASALYRELGLSGRLSECREFLQEVEKKPPKWDRGFEATFSRAMR